MSDQIELYRDKAGERRWSYRAANGRVMADSSEGYENRVDAETAATQVTGYSAAGFIEVQR